MTDRYPLVLNGTTIQELQIGDTLIGTPGSIAFDTANAAFANGNTNFGTLQIAFGAANAAFANGNTNFGTLQIAFGQANTARTHANSAFANANSTHTLTVAAFGAANAAFANANSTHTLTIAAFGAANAAFANGNTNFGTLQSAFGQANTARDHANSAFANGNTTHTLTVAAFGAANAAFANANSTHTLTVAAFGAANAAFANANSTHTLTIAAFGAANTANNLTVANTGSIVGSRNILNFIPGANVIITLADDAVGNRINVSIDRPSSSYTSNVGNGSSNTFNISHNMNTTVVLPAVREIASGYYVYPDIKVTSPNDIELEFVSAPTANQYLLILLKA